MDEGARHMDFAEHVDAVERETEDILTALRAGPLGVPMPTCPDWTLVDLTEHLGSFSAFWTHSLRGLGRPEGSMQPSADETRSDHQLIDWYEANASEMLGLLRSTDPATEVWTWVPSDQSAGFVGRRAAHELAVHRFDAQSAWGAAQPIDAALAADGIEEIFAMVQQWPRETQGTGQTVHLHGTDRGDEWMITIQPGGIEVTREHAKGDLALRGAVSDLELTLYDRPPVGAIERFGDVTVLDLWKTAFTFG